MRVLISVVAAGVALAAVFQENVTAYAEMWAVSAAEDYLGVYFGDSTGYLPPEKTYAGGVLDVSLDPVSGDLYYLLGNASGSNSGVWRATVASGYGVSEHLWGAGLGADRDPHVTAYSATGRKTAA